MIPASFSWLLTLLVLGPSFGVVECGRMSPTPNEPLAPHLGDLLSAITLSPTDGTKGAAFLDGLFIE
jgi:hypothetical protein